MKALTRLSAAFASSLPIASAKRSSGRSESFDAAPPMPVCSRVATTSAAAMPPIRSSGESRLSIMSSVRRLAVRGSTSTWTSGKRADARPSPRRSSTVPEQPLEEQPGTVTLALSPLRKV